MRVDEGRGGMGMRALTDGTWDVGGAVVLVDCAAKWCGPCKKMEPVLEALAVEWEGRVEVARADADDALESLKGMGVRSVPTFVLFSFGVEVGRWAGAMTKEKLRYVVETRMEELGL